MGASGDSHDDWIDAALRDVPAPAGFLARLARGVLLSDDALDAQIKDVPVPPTLIPRLRRIARSAPTPHVSPLAMAVGMLVGTVGYVAAAVAFITLSGWSSRWAEARASNDEIIQSQMAAIDLDFETEAIEPSLLANPQAPFELPEAPEPVRPLREDIKGLVRKIDLFPPLPPRRPLQLASAAGSGLWGPVLNAVAPSQGAESVLGSAAVDRDDSLPDLWRVVRRAKQGAKPPLEPGYDLRVQMLTHQHPIVSLDHPNPALKSVTVPLWSDSFSVDRTLRLLGRGETPTPDQIRIEDFLAAVPYEFVAPTDAALGLTAAGAPTPFGDPLPLALEIGVQAKVLTSDARNGCRLTIAVDRSGSMQRGGNFDLVRRALHGLIRRLGPQDQLSLVMFDAEAEITFENGGAADAFELYRAIDRLQPGRTTNIIAGLQTAFGAALSHPADDGLRHRIVVVTDGLAPVSDEVRERMLAAVTNGTTDGPTLSIIQVGEPHGSPDSLMTAIAAAGKGSLQRTSSADQIEWALAEILTNKSQVVAEHVKLTVEFNPQRVQGYRLVGHEASDAAMQGGPLEFDLSAGQSCAALFELRLRAPAPPRPGQPPQKPTGPIAVAKLTWRDPAGASDRTRELKIEESAFVSSLDVAPSWLQRSVIAAETAEVLRRSVYAQGSSFEAIRNAAAQFESLRPAGDGFERVLEVMRLMHKSSSTPRRDGGGQ